MIDYTIQDTYERINVVVGRFGIIISAQQVQDIARLYHLDEIGQAVLNIALSENGIYPIPDEEPPQIAFSRNSLEILRQRYPKGKESPMVVGTAERADDSCSSSHFLFACNFTGFFYSFFNSRAAIAFTLRVFGLSPKLETSLGE